MNSKTSTQKFAGRITSSGFIVADMNTLEIHRMLVENGLEPFEGISFEQLKKLQREKKLTAFQANMISLTCPEYATLKKEVLDEKLV